MKKRGRKIKKIVKKEVPETFLPNDQNDHPSIFPQGKVEGVITRSKLVG